MNISGRVWKLGNNVDTDAIIPGKYLNVYNPKELAKYCLADVRPDFPFNVQQGDILVAGSNFGCGSSREHAPVSIKAAGIAVVIASSFARIFLRNAINVGLPIIECECNSFVEEGDILEVNSEKGTIVNSTSKKSFYFRPFPEFIEQMINMGGLMEYTVYKKSLTL